MALLVQEAGGWPIIADSPGRSFPYQTNSGPGDPLCAWRYDDADHSPRQVGWRTLSQAQSNDCDPPLAGGLDGRALAFCTRNHLGHRLIRGRRHCLSDASFQQGIQFNANP